MTVEVERMDDVISTPSSICNGEGPLYSKMQKFHFHFVQLVVINNKSIWKCGSQGRLVSSQHSRSSLALECSSDGPAGHIFKKGLCYNEC